MDLPDDLKASILADVARAPSPELKASILSDLERSPSPTRSQVRRGAMAALGFCGLLAVVGVFAMQRLIGARAMEAVNRGRADLYVVIATAAFALLALAATMIALPRKSMLGPPRIVTAAVAFGAPVLLLGMLMALNGFFPHANLTCVTAANSPRAGFVCMDVSLLLGVFPVLALIFARRGGLSVRPFEAGIGTGLAVGAWTGVGVTLSCECTNSSHVALGHVLPMVLLAVFGGVVAWWSSRRPLAK